MKFKLASYLDLKFIGTISEAKYIDDANVRYLNSTQGTYNDDILRCTGMRESGTPLTAAGAGFSYHQVDGLSTSMATTTTESISATLHTIVWMVL